MKLRFSFVLCSVLIYCIVSRPSVAASDESKSDETESDSDEEFRECSGIYLKSKGKLDIEIPSTKKSSMCLFGMNFALHTMRDIFESGAKKDMPDEAMCIMTEFDKADIPDYIIKMLYIAGSKTISEDERKTTLDAMETSTGEKFEGISTTCEVDLEKLRKLLETMSQYNFDSSEEKSDSTIKTETA